MSKEKKEMNLFGKKKPTGKLIENFYISKEENSSKIKVEHKSGGFNFRIWCGSKLDKYFEDFTKGESALGYAVVFSGIQVFTATAIQRPDFFCDYMAWVEGWAKAHSDELTPEEDEVELKKVKDDILADPEEYVDEGIGTDGESNAAGEGEDIGSDSNPIE